MFRQRVKRAKALRKRKRNKDDEEEDKEQNSGSERPEHPPEPPLEPQGAVRVGSLLEDIQSRIFSLLNLDDMISLAVSDSRHRRLISGPSSAIAWESVFRQRWNSEVVSADASWRHRCIQGEAARSSRRYARQKRRHDDLSRAIDEDQASLADVRLSLRNDLAQMRKLTQAIGHELGVIEQSKSMPFPMVLSFGSKTRVKGLRGDAESFSSRILGSRAEQRTILERLKLARGERARIGGRLLRFQNKLELCARLTQRYAVPGYKKLKAPFPSGQQRQPCLVYLA